MILYGAGGHAKVALDCAKANQITIKAIFDDAIDTHFFQNIPILQYSFSHLSEEEIVVCIGDNDDRKKVANTIHHRFGKLIHPSSHIADDASIGFGTVVLHQAIVQASALVGQHVIINTAALVEHDCMIADFVHIAPKALLCGGVRVGEGALIGAGAIVLPNLNIGKWAVVGAGAVVTKDVADKMIVFGNPAVEH